MNRAQRTALTVLMSRGEMTSWRIVPTGAGLVVVVPVAAHDDAGIARMPWFVGPDGRTWEDLPGSSSRPDLSELAERLLEQHYAGTLTEGELRQQLRAAQV